MKRLPPQIFAQPHAESELLDFAVRTIREAAGVRKYFVKDDVEVNAEQLAHSMWADAYTQTRRIGANRFNDGFCCPVQFQWIYLREMFNWVAEHLAGATTCD